MTDEDAQQGDSNPPDYLLGVAWLDCGTMTFPVGSGYAAYEGTPEELLEALDLDPALIPGQIASNLVLGTGWDDVTAVAWLASDRHRQRRRRRQLQQRHALDRLPRPGHRRHVHAHDPRDRSRQQRDAPRR